MKADRGFTLVEVAAAVAILGLAFATLIGLQTRCLDRYFQQRKLEQAALYAQYLMSVFEVQKQAPDLGSETSDLKSALEKYGFFDDYDPGKDEKELEDWDYTRTVEAFDLPYISELVPLDDILRRIEVAISWGKAPDESFVLTYVMTADNSGLAGLLAAKGSGNSAAATPTPTTPTATTPTPTPSYGSED